jgi:hypothetical protein
LFGALYLPLVDAEKKLNRALSIRYEVPFINR